MPEYEQDRTCECGGQEFYVRDTWREIEQGTDELQHTALVCIHCGSMWGYVEDRR